MLPIAQLAMNGKILKTTGKTPFLSNYSKELDMFLKLREGLNAEEAIILTDDIKKLHAQLLSSIKQINNIVAT